MGDLLDPLWASTLDAVEIDLPSNAVGFSAHAEDGGKTTRYRLDCLGVSRFGYVDPEANLKSWPHAEITSAQLSKREDGGLEVVLCFWDDEREFTVLCQDARFEVIAG
jgi:hypothetical protein